MLTVHELDKGFVPPDIEGLVAERPRLLFSEPVTRVDTSQPKPVLISHLEMPNGREVLLYGARYEAAGEVFAGIPFESGHFIEYFVAYQNKSLRIERLIQTLELFSAETTTMEVTFYFLMMNQTHQW